MKTSIKLFAIAMASMVLSNQVDARTDTRSWEFSVLLDGSPIGYHRFELQPAADGLELVSEASFDVRLLFINAFRYRHVNREVWDGECLSRIESNTRQNGKRFAVNGSRINDEFIVQSGGSANPIGDCVMTFAYWNPRFLQQSRLLNPQSGEYLPVDVEPLGRKKITVRGEQVPATAWRVTARGTDLTVWYSDNDEWLGLESIARGGRILRYELT